MLFLVGKKLKVKSLALKLINKVTMEEIYWKVFGTYTVTNNEMPTWIVCGFIAQKKVILSIGQKQPSSLQKKKYIRTR